MSFNCFAFKCRQMWSTDKVEHRCGGSHYPPRIIGFLALAIIATAIAIVIDLSPVALLTPGSGSRQKFTP